MGHRVLRGTATQTARAPQLKATASAPPIEQQSKVRKVHPRRGMLPQPSEVALRTRKPVPREERERPMVQPPPKMDERKRRPSRMMAEELIASTLPSALSTSRRIQVGGLKDERVEAT